jgi:ribosome biogenesis GTPase / thiamine phosphate phosphatase
MKSTGSWYTVRTSEATSVACRVRGKMRMKGMRVTNPVAVGDKVQFSLEADGTGIIHEIMRRENYLIRRAIKKTSHGHILAANIDQAMLLATITYPRTSLGFIDRFLVAAESFRIPCILVFNKTDMWNEAMWDFAEELAAIYPPLGVKFCSISSLKNQDVESIKSQLKGKTTLLAGHSGVGKSTLLNKIDPAIQQKTAEVSDFANKGTHTTTFAEMFCLAPDTFVIDTPGIKEMGLLDFYDEEICHYFPEMRDFFGHCKFYNCTHTHEPGCAVIQAVEDGKIAPSRYESYLGIITEEESHR